MNAEAPRFSSGFMQLYCRTEIFASFSALHPVHFGRVLPFQSHEPVVDNQDLLQAEQAYLADQSDDTRRGIINAFLQCGLMQREDAHNVTSVVDYFGADFFDLMGLVYANAGMFRCALRWYRELVRALEMQNADLSSDNESVYASVGYCLYSLGLFAEAVCWSKSCIGPRQQAEAVGQALLDYELQLAGGQIRGVERSGPRTRYIVSASDPGHSSHAGDRLLATMKAYAPFQEVYIEWVSAETPPLAIPLPGYPFNVESDGGSFPRHKMNLLFAACGQADALVERGYVCEARRLLNEAAMLEPQAGMIQERIKALA